MTPARWTPQAVDDLASIRSFIERDSPRYGRIVVQRLFEATERLEACPRPGWIVPELRREEMCEIVIGDYRIVYRLDSETPSPSRSLGRRGCYRSVGLILECADALHD